MIAWSKTEGVSDSGASGGRSFANTIGGEGRVNKADNPSPFGGRELMISTYSLLQNVHRNKLRLSVKERTWFVKLNMRDQYGTHTKTRYVQIKCGRQIVSDTLTTGQEHAKTYKLSETATNASASARQLSFENYCRVSYNQQLTLESIKHTNRNMTTRPSPYLSMQLHKRLNHPVLRVEHMI